MKKNYTVLITKKHCVEIGFGMVDVHVVSAPNKNAAVKKAIEKNELTYKGIYALDVDEPNLVAVKCEETTLDDYKDGGHFFTSLISSKTPVLVVDESI